MEILIPRDCVVGTSYDGTGKNTNITEVQDNEIILDIGVETIKSIKKRLIIQRQFYGMDQLDILKMITLPKVLC